MKSHVRFHSPFSLTIRSLFLNHYPITNIQTSKKKLFSVMPFINYMTPENQKINSSSQQLLQTFQHSSSIEFFHVSSSGNNPIFAIFDTWRLPAT